MNRNGNPEQILPESCDTYQFRHQNLVRLGMKAAGIDVFATARNIGRELRTIPCKHREYGKIVYSHIYRSGRFLVEKRVTCSRECGERDPSSRN